MNRFRLLTADEIECRISQISDKGLSLLLYKTARTDANLLDETGLDWQNDFKVVDGVLYGGIGIWDDDMCQWLWKWDAGTESNTEAEKGRASDAFKRAGFKWGIGRELYTAPRIWIPADKCNIENRKCYDVFEVALIGYSEKAEINALTIANAKTHEIVFSWRLGEKVKIPSAETKAPQTAPVSGTGDFKPTCAVCGAPISVKVHDFAVKKFKRPLCMDCQKKR